MTDKIQTGFETFASKHGFDLSSAGGRYNRPVVRWMWEAWQHQAETITDLHAALSRSTARNASLVNQCRDHDTRRAAAVAQASALAAEVERLNDVISRLATPKPAALAVPDALRMELEWLEGWLHCMAEPMGQACCKRSMFECCGYPDPVYPDIAHIGTAMSKRRNDVIALLQSADHSEQAHEMVDAVNRRCEACAILPCSCK